MGSLLTHDLYFTLKLKVSSFLKKKKMGFLLNIDRYSEPVSLVFTFQNFILLYVYVTLIISYTRCGSANRNLSFRFVFCFFIKYQSIIVVNGKEMVWNNNHWLWLFFLKNIDIWPVKSFPLRNFDVVIISKSRKKEKENYAIQFQAK